VDLAGFEWVEKGKGYHEWLVPAQTIDSTAKVVVFHRIRHYGLFANASRAANIAKARALLGAEPPAAEPQQQPDTTPDASRVAPCPCPRCGARMIVIEVFARGCEPSWRPTPDRFDTS
jgi:hypothetical protein